MNKKKGTTMLYHQRQNRGYLFELLGKRKIYESVHGRTVLCIFFVGKWFP
jgi:hypothetical protein